jgi:hypothetical protein
MENTAASFGIQVYTGHASGLAQWHARNG